MRRLALLLLLLGACQEKTPGYALIGDAQRGKVLVDRYGCLACHDTGRVGPPFEHVGSRLYLAGHFANVPQNMILWIRFPQQLKPQTAMPNLGVSDRDARDIAAFLYTRR